MLSPDVLEIIDDPEVGGAVAFTVNRKEQTRIRGGVSEKLRKIPATGNIQPENKGIQQVQGEDILDEQIVIYTTFILQAGTRGKSVLGPDEIVYDGNTYRVTRVDNYAAWGFTVGHATRVRM